MDRKSTLSSVGILEWPATKKIQSKRATERGIHSWSEQRLVRIETAGEPR